MLHYQLIMVNKIYNLNVEYAKSKQCIGFPKKHEEKERESVIIHHLPVSQHTPHAVDWLINFHPRDMQKPILDIRY
jgi:hypothetical protein